MVERRSRWRLAVLLVGVVGLGLLSRSAWVSHPFLKSHPGDALWALMTYVGFAWLFPTLHPVKLAAIAGIFCLTVELSQLSDHPVLESLRSTRLGALVLGHGFLWIDLPRYAAGVLAGCLVDWGWGKCKANKRAAPPVHA